MLFKWGLTLHCYKLACDVQSYQVWWPWLCFRVTCVSKHNANCVYLDFCLVLYGWYMYWIDHAQYALCGSCVHIKEIINIFMWVCAWTWVTWAWLLFLLLPNGLERVFCFNSVSGLGYKLKQGIRSWRLIVMEPCYLPEPNDVLIEHVRMIISNGEYNEHLLLEWTHVDVGHEAWKPWAVSVSPATTFSSYAHQAHHNFLAGYLFQVTCNHFFCNMGLLFFLHSLVHA